MRLFMATEKNARSASYGVDVRNTPINRLQIKRVLDSFRNFVKLCERKEAETGEPCRITASY
jgi:hypothetical protein